MENKNTEIVKKSENLSLGKQSFIDRMIEKSASFEDIKKVGEAIINSGFCPAHFKESKDAVGIVMCIEAGQQLGLSWMQSLSNLYPVKGMIGVMGDAAKALIVSNNICEYWIEETKGSYPNDDYIHIIRSKRKGLKDEYYSEFSVWEAKQAGLFNKEMYKKWGKRMVAYRNIGFHARDKWPDIMKGFKTKEELEDFDEIITITTPDGKIITTTDTKQNDLKEKSEKSTSSVVDSIQKKKEMLSEDKQNKSKKRGRPRKDIHANNDLEVVSNINQEEQSSENKSDENNFIIPELQQDGERLFGDIQRLFFWLEDQGMTEDIYKDSTVELIDISEKYSTMEELCKKADIEEIKRVLEKFKSLNK
jgi:hypothetical protein